MPKFSLSSFSKLSTCHRDLQVLFFEVIKSFDCTVLEGIRDEQGQERAFQEGKTTLHWPNGKHNSNPSHAVDVAPSPIDWKNYRQFYYFAGYVLGIARTLKDQGKMTHSIRWGGDWDNDNHIEEQKLNDLVHFELMV
jgi:peptidoglycan L-alanyl-D-glutamate endopeptidase CwlK